jgi:acetyltransferase-like isoleucine patch superfamily enzyme
MQKVLIKLYKVWCHVEKLIIIAFSNIYCKVVFFFNGVKHGSFHCYGFPYVHVSLNAKFIVKDHFRLHNGYRFSESGSNGKCRIEVRDKAKLSIGESVGISDVTITCHERITIGNQVMIGFGVQIRDTDSHSLNPEDRKNYLKDWINKKTAPIIIEDNVFIGACSFVLKGVTIGQNSIIGIGSLVTKNVPANEIWAGNPAKFIKKLAYNE